MVLAFLSTEIGPAYAQLDEILVKARKRVESARNIPVAVTFVSAQQMDRYNLKGLQDVSELTPQITIYRASSGNGASINIRGIGPTTSSIGIEQSVAVILDGVYYGQGRVINEGLFDAQQIEILKGPQAVFFGKNATAGAINIQTNDPGDEFEVLGRVGFEIDTEQLYTEAIVSGPINEKVGVRLATRYSHMFGGYMINEATAGVYNRIGSTPIPVAAPKNRKWPGEEDLMTRLTVLFTPSDQLTARIKASYNDYSSISTSGVRELTSCPAFGTPQLDPTADCVGDWKNAENPFPAEMAATNPLINRKGGELFDDFISYSITGDAEYVTDEITITSVVNYQHLRNAWGGDFDTSNLPNVYAGERTGYNAFSAEIRGLTTFDSDFNFMIGAYHQSTTRNFDQDVIFAGAFNPAAIDPTDVYTAYEKVGATDGSTYSIYAQAIWNFHPDFELTGGARYHHENKNSFFSQPYVNPVFTAIFLLGDRNLRQKWNDISPEATLTWTVNENVTAYVAYKEAFKSGGFSISGILSAISPSVEDFAFDDEQVEGFEGGIKASLFDNTFQIEIEAYHYKFKDLQIDFFNSPVFAFVTENAGSAKTTGAELQFRWAPENVEGLLLNGSVAYNDGRYGDFLAPCWAGQTPAQGCNIFNPNQVPKQQLAGAPRDLAPKWTLVMGADYERNFGNGMLWGVSINGQFRSKYQTNAFFHPNDFQDSSFILNASIRIAGDDDMWEFAVIGRNLTDKYLILTSGDSPSSGGNTGCTGVADPLPTCAGPGFVGDRRSSPNRPRTIAFQLTVRY